jgi:Cu/Ag efflux protein CusF
MRYSAATFWRLGMYIMSANVTGVRSPLCRLLVVQLLLFIQACSFQPGTGTSSAMIGAQDAQSQPSNLSQTQPPARSQSPLETPAHLEPTSSPVPSGTASPVADEATAPTTLADTAQQLDATPTTAGIFTGIGVVTKINVTTPSVELKHEDIKGYMPAMTMEYYVKSAGMLQGLVVGDHVAFAILENGGVPTIVELKKQ